MAGLDEVLQRSRVDDDFAKLVADDPLTALAPYDLTTEEIRLLAEHLDRRQSDVSGFAALFEPPE